MGRDHTLFARAPGYVRYYRDPAKSKDRKYIGVVLQEHHTLPLIKGVARKRRLGMYAQRMPGSEEEGDDALTALDTDADVVEATVDAPTISRRAVEIPRPGLLVRKANWEIGKIADLPANQVEPFKPGARFLAWRKRTERAKKSAERQGLKNARKGKGKK